MPQAQAVTSLQISPTRIGEVLPPEENGDDDLIDRAVRDLNRMHNQRALEMACEMGAYVLENFFEGNPENFKRSRNNVSFRTLARRKDLHVSFSFLWTSVAVVGQLELLPPQLRGQLPLSHHRLLLPIKDAELKAQLAEVAVREKLSKREMAELLRRYRLKQAECPRPGRPPQPRVLRVLTHLCKSAEEVLATKTSEWDMDVDSWDRAKALLDKVETELDTLRETLTLIRTRIDTTSR